MTPGIRRQSFHAFNETRANHSRKIEEIFLDLLIIFHILSNKNNSSMPFLSMGKETYPVPLELFATNRRKLVDRMQKKNGLIYLEGGPSETRFDSDHEPLFRQESYVWYLTGVKEPDVRVIIDSASAETTLLIPRLPPEYATIMGTIRTCEEWKALYQVDRVLYSDETEDFLQSTLTSMTNGHGLPKIFLMKGVNSDSGNAFLTPKLPDSVASYADTDTLYSILAECRVLKSPSELHLLQHVTEVTSFAHAYVMRNYQPGHMEYQGESLFRHYCYYNYGCRLVGYTPICGCGPNAAILHYGHSGEPNARQSVDGDMALFDMGAEYHGYGSDVTCSFPVNGKFTDKQKGIYQAVLNAQVKVYDMLRPGVSYLDCHKASEAAILEQLIAIGIVTPGNKSVEELVEMRLGAVFMPHGLGHFIGIDTHDVGGYLPGHPERILQPGLKSLRTARIMQENMTLTVEPGCYFIDHLLDEALSGEFKEFINADVVAEYRGFGGVRLEDVVQITADGMVNYTLCPRTIEEVESVMAGGKWPPLTDTAPQLRRARLTEPNPLPAPPSL